MQSHAPTTQSDIPTEMPQREMPQRELPLILNPKVDLSEIRGPTPTTNWVVRKLVLCGGFPHPSIKTFAMLAKERFTLFVNVSEEDNGPSYLQAYERLSGTKCRGVHFPLKDMEPVPPARAPQFLEFIDGIANFVKHGEKTYIHCRSGHGRTGMAVACLLANLYGLNGMRAVNLCEALHSCRLDPEDRSSPETQDQRIGIISLLSNVPH